MTGLPARDILRKMHKAKKKAIRRSKKYNATASPPSFHRGSRLVYCSDEENEENEEKRVSTSVHLELEDYIKALEWEFQDRIAEETSRKKKDKLLKQLMLICRPCKIYLSAATLIVTRAIRQMGVQLKKERGEHWYNIRKKNAHMIEQDLRTWCRARNYTDREEDEMVRDCPDIPNALNGILPERRGEFERIALWFHNRVYPIPHWWWEWWNMENGGLEVNPSISYRKRLGLTPPAAGLKPWSEREEEESQYHYWYDPRM